MAAYDPVRLPDGRAPELLAPAGGWEQLEYAIRFGADAVYLACERFGMRQRADNFMMDELPQAVAYAHERGAAVHLTCNTQMHEGDMDALPGFLEQAQAAGVDALIVGDLGAARLARIHAPRVALHVSTQASVSNVQAALAWRDMGASRIVCAREMSLADIAHMRQALPDDLEIEAFVHGSMCMAVSGRCLISDYLCGRSATTGNCAQPCRWGYALAEETRPGQYFPVEEDARGSYIMNAKDMNMLAHLRELAAAGISSFKIEGRNKKAFYVATVVGAYRRVLDGEDPALVAPELETVSHRPYGTGFYFGPAHQNPTSDAYVREWDWAGQVVEANPAAAGGWAITALCRNRFREGDVLQALVPKAPVRDAIVRDLCHIPQETFSDGHVEYGAPVPTDVANRTMERYAFRLQEPLAPGDILRIRRS